MMSRTLSLVAAASLLAFVACDKASDGNNKAAPEPVAKTSEAPTAKPAAGDTAGAPGSSLADAAGAYAIDSNHTGVVFKIQHLGVSYQYGMFTRVEGSFTIDGKDLAKSEIDLEIPTASVFTAVKKRDDHLRSPDFFDAKQFPKITFKSKKIEATGTNTFKVTGDLSLHGVTKEATLDLHHVGSGADPETMGGAFRTGFNGETTIKRSDWNMTYMQGGGLGDEVTLLFAVEGTRK